MRENYTEQNRAFYYADSIRHNIEEMFYEGEDEFRKLKDNEWMFIRRTYRRPYDDGFERLEAVLDRAMSLCRKKTGQCQWPDIPEAYWQMAMDEIYTGGNGDDEAKTL